MSCDGLLLIGHGTRETAGQAEFEELARRVAAQLPQVIVEPCYLELAAPSISAAIDRATARGAQRLTVAPVLLFAAGHAKQDIPAAVAAAAARHPSLTWRQIAPLACDTRVLDLSAAHCLRAIADQTAIAVQETFLLLVGRGSHDADANCEMARFTRLRWEREAFGWAAACYVAMTWPTLEQGLNLAARAGLRRVVVQPHLLFQGELVDRIVSQVEKFAAQRPQIDWVLTSHLGPDPMLAAAIIEKAGFKPAFSLAAAQ